MALSNKQEVEELADALVVSADAVHERILQGIASKKLNQTKAQSLFQDETSLRITANALYLEAAKLVIKNLDKPQNQLIRVVKKATVEIKKIEKIAAFIDLVADLLVLAAAAYAAKPGPIVAALDEVQKDVDQLKKG
jgi:hypothetical protein